MTLAVCRWDDVVRLDMPYNELLRLDDRLLSGPTANHGPSRPPRGDTMGRAAPRLVRILALLLNTA